MSAKKKSAGRGAKRAKPAKVAKAKAKVKAKASAPKKRVLAKKASAKKAPAAKKLAKKLAPKKLAAKPVVKARAAKPKPAAVGAMKRRDATGHLDPKYAADLRAKGKRTKDDDRAFNSDALSKELGEEFVETVTSGEDEGNEVRDQRVTEELGGPFTVSTGGAEYANDVDGSNPKGATREPFPRT